jgi:hypothetical protein
MFYDLIHTWSEWVADWGYWGVIALLYFLMMKWTTNTGLPGDAPVEHPPRPKSSKS